MASEKRLVPSAAAQFPGSFGAGFREDYRKSAPSRGWRNVLFTYLTDGWDDISVWKSAVSYLIFGNCQTLNETLIKPSLVHRVCWYNMHDVHICYDPYNNRQFRYFTSSTVCWYHEHLPPKPLHLGNGSLDWRTSQPDNNLCDNANRSHWLLSRRVISNWPNCRRCACRWANQRKLRPQLDAGVRSQAIISNSNLI